MLAALDDAAFRALFSKSPIKRIGRDRFIRNVLIAIGNGGDAANGIADYSQKPAFKAYADWMNPRAADYFAQDLQLLQPFVADGLVQIDEQGIVVNATGRLLIRNICMCFDAYLRQKARMQQFSRVI